MARHPSALLLAAAVALSLATTTTAQPTSMQQPLPQIDCKAMAKMPSAPMSVEQCERQMAVVNQMQQALNAPGGERPGDDQMTCEQIVAELKQVAVPGVTPANAAESVAAGKQLHSAQQAAMADATATAAAGTATTAAAAAAASAVPGGNAISGAAMQAQAAQQAALVARQKPQLDAARNRAMMANTNSMADVTAMMQANPRFARLAQLVNAKQCSVPN